jgi:hypothetical protein
MSVKVWKADDLKTTFYHVSGNVYLTVRDEAAIATLTLGTSKHADGLYSGARLHVEMGRDDLARLVEAIHLATDALHKPEVETAA